MISDAIQIDAGGAIAELKAFADAAEAAASRYAAAMDKIKAPVAAGGGADKLAASLDAAAASIEAAVGKINAAMEKIGASADAAAGGLDRVNMAADAAAGGLRDAAASADESAAALDRQAEAADRSAAAGSRAGKVHSETSRTAKAAILGTAIVAAYGIDMAAKLQTQVTRLYTSAGESQKNLPMMTAGILKLSGQTATSQSDLAQGAYMIESGGYHGKDALSVLKAAAEGAKAEGAPLGEVGNALTSLMTAYHIKPAQATQAMNQIIAMVGQGKMTMAGAVSALPNVLPVAAQAGLSFGQVGGSLAQMTAMGMSPDQASQNLRHTITALQAPSHVQSLEMQQLGINSVALSKNLGKEGLTGSITQVETAIMKHMGPAGTVMLHSFNSSRLAAQSAKTEIAAMPAPLQKVASAYLDNAMSTKQYRAELQSLPPLQANVLKQFGATADAAHGFNNLLKSGGGNVQTFADALNKVMGGQVGMQTALMLGGANMADTIKKVNQVTAAGKTKGQDVTGWSDIQKTASFQFASLKNSLEAAATSFGMVLLPAATKAASILAGAGRWLADHSTASKFAAGIAGALSAAILGKKLFSGLESSVSTLAKIGTTLKIPGLDKLANAGKDSGLTGAGTSLDGAATALKGAAADLSAAAEKLAGEGGLPGGHGPGGEKPPVPGVPGEAPPNLITRVKVPLGDSAPFIIPFALSEAGKHLNPAADRENQRYLQKINRPSQSYPGIGPLKRDLIDSWALPMLSGLGAFFEGPPHAAAQPMPPSSPVYGRFGLGIRPVAPPAPFVAAQSAPGAAPGIPAALHGMHAPPIQAKVDVDLSSVTAAKTKAMTAMDGIKQAMNTGSKPVKIAAPDLSGVEAAKAKAMTAADGINQAIETPLHKPVKATAPDLSAFSAAKGAAVSDGAAISQGLASGIRAGAGAAVAAAQTVANQVAAVMAHALQTHSPSRVTEAIGADTSAGIAVGITKAAPKAKAAAATVAKATAQSWLTGLQGGQSAIDAATQALGSVAKPQDVATIQSTVAKLQDQLSAAMKKGTVSSSEDSALVKFLKADQQKLQALAAKRTQLEAEISNAQQIGQSAVSEASIMNAGNAAPTGSIMAQGADQTIQGMQAQAQQQQLFAQQVAQLQKQGLNATSLDQIIQGGATAGLPVTEGLLGGGKGAIKQVNQLESQIMKSASSLGDTGGPAMYQAGQALSSQIGKGLKSQLSADTAQMKALGQSMVNAVSEAVSGHAAAALKAAGSSAAKSFAAGIESQAGAAAAAAAKLAQAAEQGARNALKSHSPSIVFRDLGFSAPQGFTKGFDDGASMVAAAGARMAGHASSGYQQHAGMMHPYGGGGTGSGGGTVVHNHINVTVQGTVTSERDLVSAIQGHVLTTASNNWQTGWRLPGRAG